ENDAELAISLLVEDCVHARPLLVVEAGDHLAGFIDSGLEAGLDAGDGADPLVDDRERNRGVAVGVDAHVELVPVSAVVAGVGVPVQQRNTVIPTWPVRRVPVCIL